MMANSEKDETIKKIGLAQRARVFGGHGEEEAWFLADHFKSKRAAQQANRQGVNFGRRSPSSGGQNCTPNNIPVGRGALNRGRRAGVSAGHAVGRSSRPPVAWMV
jgi:hypothetical protein